MQQVKFNYSSKDIPIPTRSNYMKKMLEKTESFVQRMRWKAFFFLNPDCKPAKKETYGFKTSKPTPFISEMKSFEDGLYDMISKIKTKPTESEFQTKLRKDITQIKQSKDIFVPADKTRNFYKVSSDQYSKFLNESTTKTYKKAPKNTYDNINKEARDIASDLELDDRIEIMAERKAFISLKDHKTSFANKPSCRLINPAKSEIGLISKQKLEKVISNVKRKTQVNQWKSTSDVINWFKSTTDKQNCSFMSFDIVDYYPSITADLLKKAINFARKYTSITPQDESIIMHSRKSLLFADDKAWIKRKTTGINPFDVPMGSYDGAEVCEIVGLYILNTISNALEKGSVGLYRDDGLAIIRNKSPSETERLKKLLCSTFSKEFGLKITVEANQHVVNFLDITFNLHQNTYQPYRKPGDTPVYINIQSNHPPSILKEIPKSISTRISALSDSKETFNNAIPPYQKALKDSGFSHKCTFQEKIHNQQSNKNKRKRKILWFNPPYAKNVTTDVGKEFFKLLDTHFPKDSPLSKIFNRNTVKLSYSCTENISSIINSHNKKILGASSKDTEEQRMCSCPRKTRPNCPLKGQCLSRNIIYKATVSAGDELTKDYIGLTSTTFKERLGNHIQSFKVRSKANSTELSKYIWCLKDKGILDFNIDWSILQRAASYNPTTKRCNLCLFEKYFIMISPRNSTLNRRSELISNCRHRAKYKLTNFGIT